MCKKCNCELCGQMKARYIVTSIVGFEDVKYTGKAICIKCKRPNWSIKKNESLMKHKIIIPNFK